MDSLAVVNRGRYHLNYKDGIFPFLFGIEILVLYGLF